MILPSRRNQTQRKRASLFRRIRSKSTYAPANAPANRSPHARAQTAPPISPRLPPIRRDRASLARNTLSTPAQACAEQQRARYAVAMLSRNGRYLI
jgi:hypothetical protein